jgi:hypothetical protein
LVQHLILQAHGKRLECTGLTNTVLLFCHKKILGFDTEKDIKVLETDNIPKMFDSNKEKLLHY